VHAYHPCARLLSRKFEGPIQGNKPGTSAFDFKIDESKKKGENDVNPNVLDVSYENDSN